MRCGASGEGIGFACVVRVIGFPDRESLYAYRLASQGPSAVRQSGCGSVSVVGKPSRRDHPDDHQGQRQRDQFQEPPQAPADHSDRNDHHVDHEHHDQHAATGAKPTIQATLRDIIGFPRCLLLMPIRWYQRRISPLFPPRCKYYPSCSAYAVTAISRFGVIRGLPLAVLRLLRCQPWVVGGIDDVPQRYSLFYRFRWSKAHEEPRLTPLSQTPTRS